MNLSIEQKETHGHREETWGCQGGGEGCGMDGEFGVSRCKLLQWEWINNDILLYNTVNNIQSLGIHHDGRQYKKVYIYIHTHTYSFTLVYWRN